MELLLGALPAMALAARQRAIWRDRARAQRHQLQQALDRARHLATHDALTGLLNRRHMLALLEAERQRVAAGTAPPFTVALIDIDHFKPLNDRLGHKAGDEALATFARVATEVLRRKPPDTTGREPDLLARWGGEEFLVLLPGADAGAARQPLSRLRARLRETPACLAEPARRLQFSAGLATCEPGLSLDALLERADRALYRAKSAGRDRVACHDEPLGGAPSEARRDVEGLADHAAPGPAGRAGRGHPPAGTAHDAGSP